MPAFPVPPWMRWQLAVTPLVRTDFRRPFYLAPSNNLPGPVPPRKAPKPAMLQHVPKQTRHDALHGSGFSDGTIVPVGVKITDG